MQVDQIMKSHESKHNPYIWQPGHAHVDDKQMRKLLGILWEAFGVIDKLDGTRQKGGRLENMVRSIWCDWQVRWP
jgi:hypothetical protein